MTIHRTYDLVILGGGAAAFAAVIEASRRDRSTAIVNTGLPLGGTCVNVGCVPSKHLLEVGKTVFEPSQTPFDAVEYDADQPTVNWETAIDEKDDLVASFREQNYIDVADHYGTDLYEGYGRFVDETSIEIADGEDANTTITGETVLIATGSSPSVAPLAGIEDVPYETSETILERRTLPESVVMIGGGYIACEWGQILHHVGTDVTILQRSSHLLSKLEGQLGRELERCFENDGITVVTNVDVKRVIGTGGDGTATEKDVTVAVEVDGEPQTFSASVPFVATGVRPNTDDIGLESIGVETDDSGAIVVNEHFQTKNSNVYAAGDVVGEPMLETVAAKEGNHAVKNAFGDEGASVDYRAVPKVVFTSPEVAVVGTTEREYRAEHGTCSCRTVDMADVPKAKAVEDTRGLVQVVKHHETDAIVGVHIVGPRAADMIPEATLAVKFELTVDDIIDTIHPFPTFSEAFKHACQAFRRDTSKMSCCIE